MKVQHPFVLLVTAAIFGMSLADQVSIRQLACPFDILPLAFTLFLSMLLIAFAILRKGSKMYRALCSHFSDIGNQTSQEAILVGKDLPEVDKDAEAVADAEVAQETTKDEEAANRDPSLFESISGEAIKKNQSQSRAQKKKEKKLRQREQQQQRAACPVEQVELEHVRESDSDQMEVEKSDEQEGEQMVTLTCTMDEEKDMAEEASWCEDLGSQTPSSPGLPLEPASPSESLPLKGGRLSGARRRDLPPPPECLPPLPPKAEDGTCEIPMRSYSPALLLMHRALSKKIALGPPGLECPDSVLAMQGQRGLHASVV